MRTKFPVVVSQRERQYIAQIHEFRLTLAACGFVAVPEQRIVQLRPSWNQLRQLVLAVINTASSPVTRSRSYSKEGHRVLVKCQNVPRGNKSLDGVHSGSQQPTEFLRDLARLRIKQKIGDRESCGGQGGIF